MSPAQAAFEHIFVPVASWHVVLLRMVLVMKGKFMKSFAKSCGGKKHKSQNGVGLRTSFVSLSSPSTSCSSTIEAADYEVAAMNAAHSRDQASLTDFPVFVHSLCILCSSSDFDERGTFQSLVPGERTNHFAIVCIVWCGFHLFLLL